MEVSFSILMKKNYWEKTTSTHCAILAGRLYHGHIFSFPNLHKSYCDWLIVANSNTYLPLLLSTTKIYFSFLHWYIVN